MVAILHRPEKPIGRGVLIVVGGPQYRVGSHRQFLLLARTLSESGVPVLRFDYRGMGDSEGEGRTFEAIDADIRAAIDAFVEHVPQLREIAIWGLCDAASAATFYAAKDSRVIGLVLLNPWVRTEAGAAGAVLKRYYAARLMDPNLWRKIGRGEFSFANSLSSLWRILKARFGWKPLPGTEMSIPADGSKNNQKPLPDQMLQGLQRFTGKILLIISGDDLTAAEFKDVVGRSSEWRHRLRDLQVQRYDLEEANHTFARRAWRDQVAQCTLSWLRSW